MKNTNRPLNDLEYVTAGKKRQNYRFSFAKKDAVTKNMEIIIACIVAFVIGMAVYQLLR